MKAEEAGELTIDNGRRGFLDSAFPPFCHSSLVPVQRISSLRQAAWWPIAVGRW